MSPNYSGIGGVRPESYGSAMGLGPEPKPEPRRSEVSYSPPISEVVNNMLQSMSSLEELAEMLSARLAPVLNVSPVCQSDDIYPATSNSPLASDLIHINQRMANLIKRLYELRDDIQL